jgi:hypothetical protein
MTGSRPGARTARLVRELAEGEELSTGSDRSAFQTALMVFGVLFSLELLFMLAGFF